MTATTILPHETAEDPQDPAAWQLLLATAPRSIDRVGRATIQVCSASDGCGIYATVDYAMAVREREGLVLWNATSGAGRSVSRPGRWIMW